MSTTPVFKAGIPKALFPAPIFTTGGSPSRNVTRYDVTGAGKKFLINSSMALSGSRAAELITIVNWMSLLKKPVR